MRGRAVAAIVCLAACGGQNVDPALESGAARGFDVVAEVVGLRERLQGADLVLTGEGRLDGQTRYGKTVAGVIRLASEAGVPVIVVPGVLGEGWEWALPHVAAAEPVSHTHATPLPAMRAAAERLSATTERAVRTHLIS